MTNGSSTHDDDLTGQDGGSNEHNKVSIERVFNAPVDLVWALWTDPVEFAAWYGPAGAAIAVVTMDVRVGGTRLINMTVESPNGPMQMWFTGTYLEVADRERLVYTESMSNEKGDIIAPVDLGMAANHPTTTEIRVDFEDLGSRTKMVMIHVGIPADSPGAAGWISAIDKLTAYVAGRL